VLAGSLGLGFCLSGGQKANNALSVYFYPTALRGTGLGWGLWHRAHRRGAGAMAAGPIAEQRMESGGLFYAAAVPMIVGGAAIWRWANSTATAQTPLDLLQPQGLDSAVTGSLRLPGDIGATKRIALLQPDGEIGHDRQSPSPITKTLLARSLPISRS
jgi:hypothetical protein